MPLYSMYGEAWELKTTQHSHVNGIRPSSPSLLVTGLMLVTAVFRT